MLIEKKGLEILDDIDSSSPTPGGGSVSALVAALGISLSRMYAHLSIHKKKFLSLGIFEKKIGSLCKPFSFPAPHEYLYPNFSYYECGKVLNKKSRRFLENKGWMNDG